MKACLLIHLFAIVFVFSSCKSSNSSTQEASDTDWAPETAAKWFQGRTWANGLSLNAHPSTDTVTFAQQYHKNQKYWDEAFDFLKNTNLDTLSDGRHVIDDDNVYATVTTGPAKDSSQTKWESHKQYTDLQYVIKGKEKIGVAPVSTATVTIPYDSSKDLANYTANGTFYEAEPGTFFLFFPQQTHRPGNKVEGYDTVKKLVIKIRNAE